MSKADDSETGQGAPLDDADRAALQSLLKGALREGRESRPIDVLSGVQKKLRERSGGKFYADVWSTAKQPPTLTFLVTSAIMLAIVLLAFAILVPLSGKPESVKTEPAPVDVMMPAPR
jgi:hypothetical protein